MPYDVFICYAHEDKADVARPLALALKQRGFTVWFDEMELQIGDGLRQKLDEGIRSSRYGVVILSPKFFAKNWPKWELDGLADRELSGGKVVVLPVWHKVGHDEVAAYSPSLANKFAAQTAEGVHGVADQIAGRFRATGLEGGRPLEWTEYKGSRGHRRRSRLTLLGFLIGAVVMLGVIVAVAMTASGPPKATRSFPVSAVNSTIVNRSWSLEGTTVTGQVQLTNGGATPADLSYDEVIPTSTARSVSDLHQISPGYSRVVQSDLVVLHFVFPQVPPGETRSITYEAEAPGSGPAGKRLDRLVADQRKAEALYDGQNHINQTHLDNLVIEPKAVSLSVGQSTALTLSGSMDDGTPAPPGVLNATWMSSRPDVASVVSGTVRATASGAATVKATVGDSFAECAVTVMGTTTLPTRQAPFGVVSPPSNQAPSSTPTSPPSPAPVRSSTPTPPPNPAPVRSSTPTPPPPPAAPKTEQENPHYPSKTFRDHHIVTGDGPSILAGATVQVTCKLKDPSISSVSPDGYWYKVASPPWNNAYWTPANNFLNGDPYNGPYSRNTDWAVPDC